MSSKPNGIMVTDRPNSVRVRYQKKTEPHMTPHPGAPDGLFPTPAEKVLHNAVEDAITEVTKEVEKRHAAIGLGFKVGDIVRVTLLVEVVK